MKRLLLLGIAAIFAQSVFAFNAELIFSADDYAKLVSGEHLEKTCFLVEGSKLDMNPDTPLCKEAAESWPDELVKPNFLVEEIYLIPKSELGSGSKATVDYAGKLLRSFSKMQGIQYYSHSEKKTTTLYEKAYCIAGADDRSQVADDTAGDPDGQIRFCLLNDHSLGESCYRVTYTARPDEVRACMVNLDTLKVGPIKAINEGALRMNIVISDCGDYLCLYLTSETKVPKLKILEERMQNSFTARLEAIYNWFLSEFKN